MSIRALSFAWLWSTILAFLGTGGYWIYDVINPTGSQWLLSSGYIFNPPKFTSHESKDNYCFENLFKEDPAFDLNKAYGCRVAELNIWSSGEQFKEQKIVVDYLTFTKKLTVRKKDQGLQIIRIINNREGLIIHTKLTYYKRQGGRWNQNWLEITSKNLSEKDQQRTISTILSESKHLHFEADNNLWYKQENHSHLNQNLKDDQLVKNKALHEIWKDHKSGSWIWIESESGGIPIWDGLSYAFKHIKKQAKWDKDLASAYFPVPEKDAHRKPQLTNNLYDNLLKDLQSNGKWIDTEKFCNYGYERNISKDQRKNLKIYCSKPKSKD